MPALNDKVFLPISIFVLNIILAVFSFILLCAVGAAFAIYSKYGGEYANSVRWTWNAGYLEMIKTTVGSSKSAKIPRSAKIALVVGLFVTVGASFLDKGIARYVNPASRPGSDSTRIVVISPQLASNTIRKKFAGWSFVVQKDGNITATMEKALSSSLAIPEARSDRSYTPVISNYTIKCAYFKLTFEAKAITEDGCAKEYNTDLTSKIFADTSDELLLAMNESFKTKTIPPSNRSVELWVELRAKNSSVDILACTYDTYQLNDNPLVRNVECAYHTINAFVMTQPFNPEIKKAAKLPGKYQSGTFMVLDHVPTTNGKNHAPISLSKLRNDTAAVSDYMARLGTNAHMNYTEGKFYGQYDMYDVQSGLEIPLWVLIVSGFILIVSLILWQLTNWIVDSSHTSSLYKIMAMRMGYHTDTPVLLRAKLEPFELEGVGLIPSEGIQGADSMNKA
ncbi:hypothetical protein BGX34_006909 [Mortierella sp. NVP85]|nr:hypothetical protein BGX34_006909 [Mortierella sp. NVP85]